MSSTTDNAANTINDEDDSSNIIGGSAVKGSVEYGFGAIGKDGKLLASQYENSTLADFYFKHDEVSVAKISSFSNQFHRYLAYGCGLAAYFFGSAMHVSGQGSFLTSISLFSAGSCLFLNAENRNINGPTNDIFYYETVGAWLWMLPSFRQFSAVKKMKYAGYSSWSALMMTGYYSARYLYDTQVIV
eukprot:Tbor_TRINITY_DN4653_c0_g1::TRINITY_DN4653_c0_g1_i3::g.14887::m.14887